MPPDRCPMGPDSPPPARVPASPEGRAAAGRLAALLRGHALDSMDRGPLERTAARYGSPSTCWRRLRQWEATDVLLAQLNDAQKLRWHECFLDGSFALAKKGAPKSGRPSAGRGQSGWYGSMARVLRWEHTWTRHRRRKSGSSQRPSTPSRAGQPWHPRKRPDWLIADRGDDSNAARALLARRGLEPIIPAPKQQPAGDAPGRAPVPPPMDRGGMIGWRGNFPGA